MRFEPFRLGRLRDTLLGMVGMFAAAVVLGGAFTRSWDMVIGGLGVIAVATAFGRHPRIVLAIAIGSLAVGSPLGFVPFKGAIWALSGHPGQGIVLVLVSLGVIVAMVRFVPESQWRYGPATPSDKAVVAGTLLSLGLGLVLLLKNIHAL